METINKSQKGCGARFHQEKDDFYSEGNISWRICDSICGETFDEKGTDYCGKCLS